MLAHRFPTPLLVGSLKSAIVGVIFPGNREISGLFPPEEPLVKQLPAQLIQPCFPRADTVAPLIYGCTFQSFSYPWSSVV